jgi:hypothetical membrane protein
LAKQVSTNKVLRGEKITRALALFTIFSVEYFGLVILAFSMFDQDYNPITLPASDYGVGRFALEMNLGFFLAGIGFIAFAVANLRQRTERRSRVATGFLVVAGLVLTIDSYFHTNLQGQPADTGAVIHGFGGFFFFLTAPIGILLVARKLSRSSFLITLVALLIGFVILGAPDNAGGLAERVLLAVIFFSVILDTINLYSRSKSLETVRISG